MSKRNQSELLLAKLVARLAENGVVTEDVSAKEMFGDEPSGEEIELFASLVDWLEAEGILRVIDPPIIGTGYGPIYTLVLTSLGFRQLDQNLSKDLTLGEAIKRVAQTPSVASTTGEFVSSLLGGLTKSVSG